MLHSGFLIQELILDSGFWILDAGIDSGFWILDSLILEFDKIVNGKSVNLNLPLFSISLPQGRVGVGLSPLPKC